MTSDACANQTIIELGVEFLINLLKHDHTLQQAGLKYAYIETFVYTT